jgi:excisionase family DNA binding protein
VSAAPKLAAMPANRAPVEPADILTPAELAKRLKLPLSWVYKQSAKGSIPVLRCGGYLRFDWTAVSAWLRSRQSLDNMS